MQVSARCAPSRAASTSTKVVCGSSSSISVRPCSRSSPTPCRSLDSSTLSAFLASAGASAPQPAMKQLVARQGPAAVEHQVSEEDSPLAPGQGVFDAGTVDDDDEATAEL